MTVTLRPDDRWAKMGGTRGGRSDREGGSRGIVLSPSTTAIQVRYVKQDGNRDKR